MGVLGLAVKAGKKAAARAPAIVKSVEGAEKRKAAAFKFDRERLKEEYPEVPPSVLATDAKTGKTYTTKGPSAEADAVLKARAKIRKDMQTNGYDPMFNVADRSHVNPDNYPMKGRTLTDALPSKDSTRAEYEARVNTPTTLANLSQAYEAARGDPLAHDWYGMGQLEKAFVDELGPEAGRAAFRSRFAEGMAATTGGADPTANFLTAQFGNFRQRHNLPVPTESYNLPHPIGGRFIGSNLSQFNRFIAGGEPLEAKDNPKRFNFAANFMGHRDRATIDEQMSGLYEDLAAKGVTAPPKSAYGAYEKPVHDLAAKYGTTADNVQEVAWAGAKGVGGKPMISHVNDAIERTSRLTGMDPEEVLRQIIIRANGPTFAEGGHVDRAALAEKYEI